MRSKHLAPGIQICSHEAMGFAYAANALVSRWSSLLVFGALLTGCLAGESDLPSDEDESDIRSAAVPGSIADAANKGCSTTVALNLSKQIVDAANCIQESSWREIDPTVANITVAPDQVPYLVPAAADALEEFAVTNPDIRFTLNSVLRSVAQQYMIYRWYQTGRCRIPKAAKPGNSNHEQGLAFDTSEASKIHDLSLGKNMSSEKDDISSYGFQWFGSSDKYHFTFVEASTPNTKGLDVRAYQALWNASNPHDPIQVTGTYTDATAARLAKTPIQGFSRMPTCDELRAAL